jgi:sulfatase maturation enzyme AslB (radical SAM superfamily)
MSKIPDNFCFHPWTGVYIDNNTIGPCCVNYKLYRGNNIEEYLASNTLRKLKDSFLNNEKHPFCNTCWKEESLGIKSIRQRNKVIKSKDYYYFTIRLSKKCNFTCRMCHPKFSSAWALDKEAIELIDKYEEELFDIDSYKKNIEYFLEKAKNNKITIVFIGGEPLISEEFLYFLNRCDELDIHKNIELSINTNLSVYKYKNIDYSIEFNKFYWVNIHASMDGLGKVGEYIRRGYKQKIFDYNLNKLKKYINSINVTVQAYNIYDMPHIYKYAENKGIRIIINYVHYPFYLSIAILDKIERLNILKYYSDNNFNNEDIINAINKEPFSTENIEIFIKYTKSLDLLWKTNMLESIPELKSWFERIDNEKYNMV